MKKQEEKKSYPGTCVNSSEQVGFKSPDPKSGKSIDLKKSYDRIESTFWFHCEYEDKETKQIATIVLEINYRTSQYSILPYCGTTDSGFNFVTCSHKFKMWKAILQCINDAIDFAEKELKQ